jgi:hypothetical protein
MGRRQWVSVSMIRWPVKRGPYRPTWWQRLASELAEYATFDFCLKAGAVVYVILCVIWLDVHRNASWFTWCVAIIWPVTKSLQCTQPRPASGS